MSAYKDKTQGTWYVSFRYIDWTGKKTQKLKRGFKTKKEALNYEKEFIRKTAADMKMEMNSFIQVYFEDKKNELKENSIRNKQHMMNKHIVPYFGTRKMNEITPAEIIQWQNTIQEKGYSKTYERMIQNQLNALFNHAQKIYNLKENPCKKVKKMGKSDANKLEFWTKAEYDRFIAGIEPGSEDYLIFEILFWTGIREGAEDGLGDTIKPRLLAAGADCSKVMVIDDSDQPLTMADVRLEEAIVQTKAKMVVLDPIQGFLGANVDMHRANEIRPLMKRIAVLAEKYHCAVILIGHMNKNSNGKSSYRGLGSIDFQAAARSVLIVGRVKEEPEVRVVCHTKSSLAPEGMSIAFRLDKNNGFEWIGEYDISADELLNGDGRGQKSQKAKEFLLEILANGGMAQKKIAEEAEGRGIKGKTLWNAKRELEIDSVKRGKQWYWMLPE